MRESGLPLSMCSPFDKESRERSVPDSTSQPITTFFVSGCGAKVFAEEKFSICNILISFFGKYKILVIDNDSHRCLELLVLIFLLYV